METMAANAALSARPGSRDLPEPTALNGVKVMVIDDSNTIRRSAEIFLLQAGCTVILADDGFDALAKITDHLVPLRNRNTACFFHGRLGKVKHVKEL